MGAKNLIPSFCVNHLNMNRGIFVSRIDVAKLGSGNVYLTTDLKALITRG